MVNMMKVLFAHKTFGVGYNQCQHDKGMAQKY
jgi:hypothetical protein